MGISSSDIANASANDALRKLEDQAVIIEWLKARVEFLEGVLGQVPEPCPELPSQRSRRLYREQIERYNRDGWPRYGLPLDPRP